MTAEPDVNNAGLVLSYRDIQIIKCVVHDNWQEAIEMATRWGWIGPQGGEVGGTEVERRVCERALEMLDLTVPWDV